MKISDLIPVITAFFAALIGSFFGALFKEQMSDVFFKRKRKRELQGAITKEIIIFYNVLHAQTMLMNTIEVTWKQKDLLNEMLGLPNLPDDEMQAMKDESAHIIDFGNAEVEKEHRLSEKVSELEGNIHALIIEACQYLTRKKATALKDLLPYLQKERHTQYMLVDIYDGPDYKELLKFRDQQLRSEVYKLQGEKDERKWELVEIIQVLLK